MLSLFGHGRQVMLLTPVNFLYTLAKIIKYNLRCSFVGNNSPIVCSVKFPPRTSGPKAIAELADDAWQAISLVHSVPNFS